MNENEPGPDIGAEEIRLSGQVETFAVVPNEDDSAAPPARTFTALALPWNQITQDFRRLSFAKGSVELPPTITHVKFVDQHDSGSTGALIGVIEKASSDEDGLRLTVRMATTPEADKVWHLMTVDKVMDGVSVGLTRGTRDFRIEYNEDEDSGIILSGPMLAELSAVTIPAFINARAEFGSGILAAFSAAASNATGTRSVTSPEGNTTTVENDTNTPAEIDVTGLSAAITEGNAALLEGFATALREAFPAASQATETEGLAAAPGLGLQVTERPVYGLGAPGSTYSLIRDFSTVKYDEADPSEVADARDRLKSYQAAAQKDPNYDAFTSVRSDLPALSPTVQRPDLYQEQLDMSRPLYDSVSKGVLSNITPFVFPKWVSSSGLTADHTEGTNPTPGTITVSNQTITPKAISGSFKGSRELFDAATPQLDAIVLKAMKIDYEQKIEALIAARLDAVTLTGVHAQVLDLSDSTGDDGALLIDLLTAIFIDQAFTFTGFRIDRAVSSKEPYTLLANAKDSAGRRLIPAIGAQNADGARQGAGLQGINMDGQYILPGAITARKLYAFASESVWVGLSAPKMFRFEEKDGPANIELAVFGYEATAVTRDSDIYRVTVQD